GPRDGGKHACARRRGRHRRFHRQAFAGMEGGMMEPRISIVTVAVEDLDRSARFYEAMGLARHRIQDGVAFFQMGGAILALFPRVSAEEDAGIAFGTAPSRVYLAYN